LEGGRVLVTGISSDGLRIGSVDIYDPAIGWTVGPKLSSDLPGAVVAPLPGGGALLAGGVPYLGGGDSIGPGPTAAAVTYSPSSGGWTAAANMSSPRSDATATVLPDGRVLVAGGYNWRVIRLNNPPREAAEILPHSSSQLFNPISFAWTAGPSMTNGRFAHSAVYSIPQRGDGSVPAASALLENNSHSRHLQTGARL
jgi:hypothetical protein